MAFAGTPGFAVTILRGLLDSDHEVGIVVSQPDARRGRGRKTAKTPVAELALLAGLALRQPARISEVADEISRHDALVVAAYGQILRPDTLYAARHGAWNVHASLLPAYRGAAPVERAVMAGEAVSGVSIMRMEEGLDTGPVALQREVPIAPNTTGGELAEEIARSGSGAVVEVLDLLEAGDLALAEQDDARATYAPKISASERVVDWGRGAREVHDLVRALAPHIGARTFHPDVDGPVRVLRSVVYEGRAPRLAEGEIHTQEKTILVGCGEGVLEIQRLQLPGAKPLESAEFLVGNTLEGGFSR